MSKTIVRLTKQSVREEVQVLRDKINRWSSLTRDALEAEYAEAFPTDYADRGQKIADMSREFMSRALIISATYYMTNVLNVE